MLVEKLRQLSGITRVEHLVTFRDKKFQKDGATAFFSMSLARLHAASTHLLAIYMRRVYEGTYQTPPDESPLTIDICGHAPEESPTSSHQTSSIVNYFMHEFHENTAYELPLTPGDQVPFFNQIAPKITQGAPLEEIIEVLDGFGLGANEYALRPTLTDDWEDKGGNVYAQTP